MISPGWSAGFLDAGSSCTSADGPGFSASLTQPGFPSKVEKACRRRSFPESFVLFSQTLGLPQLAACEIRGVAQHAIVRSLVLEGHPDPTVLITKLSLEVAVPLGQARRSNDALLR